MMSIHARSESPAWDFNVYLGAEGETCKPVHVGRVTAACADWHDSVWSKAVMPFNLRAIYCLCQCDKPQGYLHLGRVAARVCCML